MLKSELFSDEVLQAIKAVITSKESIFFMIKNLNMQGTK